MSASNPSDGNAAAENELLARLGLPPSASAEDVDQLHLAVSQFLAAAPSGIKGWARAQAAELDEAYLTLTDPVGLEGSALRSPTRPPTVVPGGPATPPARRDPVSAVVAAPVAAMIEDEVPAEDDADEAEAPADEDIAAATADATDTDDLDALYASVTPGAHRDMTSGGQVAKAAYPAAPAAAPRPKKAGARVQAAAVAPAPTSSSPWKLVAIITSIAAIAMVLIVGGVVVVANLNSNGGTANASSSPAASAGIDMAQVQALMQKITADPKDTASLQQLGDLYYQAGDYGNAGTFYDKVLAVDPKNVKGLLARGAVYYNTGDMVNAKKSLQAVIEIDPKNVEAHYDLGFVAMNQASPDWSTVKSEWQLVIQLDPTSTVATQVQKHLDALVAASMIPGGSAAPVASGSPAASGSAAPSGAVSSASPAPSASAASGIVTEGAQNLAFTASQLSAPANSAFILRFDNKDSGLPHDILIKDSTGKTVFSGDMVTGPASVDYQVPALAAGTYTFTCTIHPTTMNGTLKVGS